MKDKCIGMIGRIFGHNFIQCYSLGSAQPMQLQGSLKFAEIMMDKSRVKKYQHSVCKRCGMVVGESK